ncbi:MAG: response regulator [Micavibrio aeruginosavorus]|uniref:Response regulator n=1 Tax=Micavibrio aeruginosavorus TaxID=349221 RepID=A0A7T5UGT5_9BACT|nr:MAG: response regulator [Micavibrio aeruginosavorus]
MKTIRESPEHHFLTFLDKVKQDGNSWFAIHCAQSETLNHENMIEDLTRIRGRLHEYRQACEMLVTRLAKAAVDFSDATLYVFTDGDLLLLANPGGGIEEQALQEFYRELAGDLSGRFCRYGSLNQDIYSYQRLADERFVSARRMTAYETMADEVRVSSVPLRRDRRKDTLVLIVEDDRFTAAIAANILNKDYEIVHAKTGEDAIISYMDHAPDVVFLDIHLPGLSGHQTLEAIRKIDPAAHVVMLSVDAVKTNIVEASKGGAAGFLKKPFTKERMIAMVKTSPFYKPPRSSGLPQHF